MYIDRSSIETNKLLIQILSGQKAITLILLCFVGLISCKQEEVNGILIGDTLLVHQSFQENRELVKLIERTLGKDHEALKQITNVWCGAGAGCYELGFIVTQIIYKIGLQDFELMASQLDHESRNNLLGLIQAGLEYFDNDENGQIDNTNCLSEFPSLYALLTNP